MARIKRSAMRQKRHRRVIKEAKGYFGRKKSNFKIAHEQVMKSGQYAFRDRRQKKRDFRRLWIVRISAACDANDIKYARFIAGLKSAGIQLDRKILSEIAISDPVAFSKLAQQAKAALA